MRLAFLLLLICLPITSHSLVEENCEPSLTLPKLDPDIQSLGLKLMTPKSIDLDLCEFQRACEMGLSYTFKKVEECKGRASRDLVNKKCSSLTDKEFLALRDYTGPYYQCMNGYLRQKDFQSPVIEAYIHYVEMALKKLPSYQGFVVRGATLNSKIRDLHQVGKIIVNDGFTSTSTAGGFSGADNFLIYSKNAKMVMSISQLEMEYEALYPPGAKFEILEKVSLGNDHFYIMAEVVDGRPISAEEKKKILNEASKFKYSSLEKIEGAYAKSENREFDYWECGSDKKLPKTVKQLHVPLMIIPNPDTIRPEDLGH